MISIPARQKMAAVEDTNIDEKKIIRPCVVGPCHHGMALPQVADRGTASFMEGSCE